MEEEDIDTCMSDDVETAETPAPSAGVAAPVEAWTDPDVGMGPEEVSAPVKRVIDLTGMPVPTQQLLATLEDAIKAGCSPYGLTSEVDVDIGCSSDIIVQNMRKTELVTTTAAAEPKHIAYRRVLVDWMCELGEVFRIQKTTMHVAIGYLDRILQDVSVSRARLQLVALCCLLIATKYEEAEENVPSVRVLAEYTNNTYQPSMIHQMEIMVLTRLSWSLTVVTPLHFLGLYIEKGMIFTTDTMQGVPLIPKVPRYVKKYVEFFADLTLQEYAFQRYLPSKLAAAIVAASRRALSIRPLWNKALTELVGYSQLDIADVFTHVWKYYLECFPTEGAAADKAHAPFPTPTNVTAMVEDLDE